MTERRPLTPDDFWQMRFLTDTALAPDGQHLAYVVLSADREANQQRSAIWLLDLASGESRALTAGTARDTSPCWSPDGRLLAFTSDREGEGAQVYLLALAGGEARRLTHMRRGTRDPFWSSDGAWVGFESEVRPGEAPDAEPPHDAATRERERREEAERPRIITRLQYRWDGKGYFEGRRHLFRVRVGGGAVEALTDGDYDDSDGACSPDGRLLAFVSDRSDERDANDATDLWLLDLQSRALRRLSDGHAQITKPAWSPDGRHIACYAEPTVGTHSTYDTRLLVAEVATGRVSYPLDGAGRSAAALLYNDLPRPGGHAPVWSPDGATLLFATDWHGGTEVLRVPVAGGEVATVLACHDHHLAQFALTPDARRLVALACQPTDLWAIWEYPLAALTSAGEPRRLTDLNGDLLAGRLLSVPERLSVEVEGHPLDAWLCRPVGPASTDNAPLVLYIHGGPHAAFGQSFSGQAQMLAGLGYAVLYANPRGSTGYGEAFAQACDHDWGGGDYRDLMAVVDAALARGGLDATRLAVTGPSYGGYMTNWIVTQTDRFAAAVTLNSVTNLASSFGTADIDSVWAPGDNGGWPWERAEYYRERSPLTHAPRVTTPIRIIAAENDYRCPISQSEEWYTWLKRLGRAPVDFVRLPGASHGVFATPRQRVLRQTLVIEWITRYCPSAGTPPTSA